MGERGLPLRGTRARAHALVTRTHTHCGGRDVGERGLPLLSARARAHALVTHTHSLTHSLLTHSHLPPIEIDSPGCSSWRFISLMFLVLRLRVVLTHSLTHSPHSLTCFTRARACATSARCHSHVLCFA